MSQGDQDDAAPATSPDPEGTPASLVVRGRDPEATARAELVPILVFFLLAPLAVGLLVFAHVVLEDLPWYDSQLAVIGWLGGCVVIGVVIENSGTWGSKTEHTSQRIL